MRTRRLLKFGIVLFALTVVFASVTQAQDDQLRRLRADFAMRFLEPEPHMALAKYFLDRGQRLQAFHILEGARRSRFEEKVFDHAFQLFFQRFDNSPEGEASLLKELAKDPQSEKVNFDLADVYISRSDWPQAKKYLSAAIQIRPDNFKYVSALARVLRLEGNNQEADRLTKDFYRRYPDSEAAWFARIEELIEKYPVKAKALTIQARGKFPKAPAFAVDLGRILQKEKRLEEAEKAFVEAADLAPESADIQAWTGRYFLKVRLNKPRALEYYFNAYFLNPHAYDSEYAESRIANLSREFAEAEFAKQTRAGKSIDELLNHSDPSVVRLALQQLSEKWKPEYLEPVIRCLDHDDEVVRWLATEGIKVHVDRSFDPRLKALLADDDLRKRGMAAYIAVYLWKRDSFELMKKMLTEESQLLRYDAASALIMEGGEEGRQIALDRAASEKHPTLKKLLGQSKRPK